MSVKLLNLLLAAVIAHSKLSFQMIELSGVVFQAVFVDVGSLSLQTRTF